MRYLLYKQDGAIGILRINRPDALNALNSEVIHELNAFLDQPELKESLRVLILTGAGDKAFVAGADIREMKSLSPSEAGTFAHTGHQLSLKLERLPFVTIAAVNGFAFGGGFELALACDFIYASNEAVLGLPEVSLGLIPGFGGTQRLSRIVGTRRAKELIFRGQKISAEEALALQIVNAITAQEELLSACQETAQVILRNSFAAVIRAKRAVDQGYSLPMDSALQVEAHLFEECFQHPDRKEGLHAFIEKRPTHFE